MSLVRGAEPPGSGSRVPALLARLDAAAARTGTTRLARLRRAPGATLRHLLVRLAGRLFPRFQQLEVRAETFYGATLAVTVPPGADLWLHGIYADEAEVRLCRFLIQQLGEGDVFLDLGANFGFFSLLAAELVGERGRVFAFEPSPAVLPFLNRNAAGRRNLEVVERAVSDREGAIPFYVGPRDYVAASTLDPANLDAAGFRDTAAFAEVEVEAIRIDRFCRERQVVPAVVKIDVEGAEHRVLLGAAELLARHSPAVVMEVWLDTPTENYRAAIRLLIEQGYRPGVIRADGSVLPIAGDTLDDFRQLARAHTRSSHGIDNLVFRR